MREDPTKKEFISKNDIIPLLENLVEIVGESLDYLLPYNDRYSNF